MTFLKAGIALGENMFLALLMIGLIGLPVSTILLSRWLAKKQAARERANEGSPQLTTLQSNLGNLASGCFLSILLLVILFVAGFVLLDAFFPGRK